VSLILGIDPGCGTTGLALVEGNRVFWHKTLPGEDALNLVIGLRMVHRFTRAVVERPREAVLYARHMQKSNAVRSLGGIVKLSQNVGMNMKLTDDFCVRLRGAGVTVHDPHPTRGWTKWPENQWTMTFNWPAGKRLPSSHARDAACLALQHENWRGWTK
jgi:hypothetical protein